MADYLCRRKCVYNGRLFKAGMRVSFDDKEKVPEHFEKTGSGFDIELEEEAPKKRRKRKSGK